MIHAQARAKAHFQLAAFLPKQIIQLQRDTHAVDVLVKQPRVVAIAIADSHTITQSLVPFETAVIVNAHYVLST